MNKSDFDKIFVELSQKYQPKYFTVSPKEGADISLEKCKVIEDFLNRELERRLLNIILYGNTEGEQE